MSLFITVDEAIDLRLLGNDDYQKRDRLRLRKFAKYVWQDLNLSTVKRGRRSFFYIDKRTNSVTLPCGSDRLCSVSIVDRYGNTYPVYRNHTIKSDIVDIGAAKNCACENECSHQLCNIIKGYEAVISTKEDKNPDGSTVYFECIDRKGVDDQGFLYEQKQYPKRIYEEGEWVSTILYTENIKLCKVDVDDNGCVCDTEENINAVCTACGINTVNKNLCCIGGDANTPPEPGCSTWIYKCSSKLDWLSVQCGQFPYMPNEFCNIYNISEMGDRIIFPPNFGWDKVMIRWYDSPSDIEIPLILADVFVTGLMWWDCRFSDKRQQYADRYSRQYADLKFGSMKDLNRYRIEELGKIMSPPVYVPSFEYSRTNMYEGSKRRFLR